MAATAVYLVGPGDEGVEVRFEVDPDVAGFVEAGMADEVAGWLEVALGPVVEGARAVLDRVREVGPSKVEVAFGVKATGTANFVVAKAASEGNFAITLTWEKCREEQ